MLAQQVRDHLRHVTNATRKDIFHVIVLTEIQKVVLAVVEVAGAQELASNVDKKVTCLVNVRIQEMMMAIVEEDEDVVEVEIISVEMTITQIPFLDLIMETLGETRIPTTRTIKILEVGVMQTTLLLQEELQVLMLGQLFQQLKNRKVLVVGDHNKKLSLHPHKTQLLTRTFG
jgi:hypothetical protein